MSENREERIRQFRLKQPLAELQRKSDKSRERANIWTQEELDCADAEATEMVKFLNRPIPQDPLP